MKKIQFILFSFLLILGLLIRPNIALANSLRISEPIFRENNSLIFNGNLSFKNQIAQTGPLMRSVGDTTSKDKKSKEQKSKAGQEKTKQKKADSK